MEQADSKRWQRWTAIWVSLVFLFLLTWLDTSTSDELGFEAFYILPIAVSTWYAGNRIGCFMAFFTLGAWFLSEKVSGHTYSSHFFAFWAALNHALAFALFLGTFAWLRKAIRMLRLTNAELSAALAEVKELKGLVPVCAWCKRIRDDQGYWDSMEAYISSHTKATFSHGICPECKARMMADVPEQTQKGIET